MGLALREGTKEEAPGVCPFLFVYCACLFCLILYLSIFMFVYSYLSLIN